METKIKQAIYELSKYYVRFNNIQLEFIHANETKIENGILYFDQVNKGLLCLVNYLNGCNVTINDHFDRFGTMIDLSRNAVYTVDYMKSVIRKQALMGVNSIMLYTEDTYEVEGLPYFGYMRGRYNKEEIKAIVSYAKIFDIEIIPCIQTLGHMEQFLRWSSSFNLRDNDRVLLVDNPETYVFIEKLISSLREMYDTNKIHIGMDEAQGLGLGRYFKKHGFVEQFEIFSRHLNRVVDILKKYEYDEIMIWSDMYFRMASLYDEYYDTNITFSDDVKNSIPENVQLVYWDYYQNDKNRYDLMIKKHQELSDKVIMASGIWTWTKFIYDKNVTNDRALKAIDACIDNKIKSLYFTEWGDDGAYCEMETSLLGLFDMANHSFLNNQMDKAVFRFITNSDYEVFDTLTKLNEAPILPVALLWDDPLLGIYLNNENARDNSLYVKAIDFYQNYSNTLRNIKESSFTINHALLLSEVLKAKLQVRKELVERYHNHQSLDEVIAICDEAISMTKLLLESFRQMWMSRYKQFGFEVLQSRLAMIIIRLEETKRRISEYLDKTIYKIDELEEPVGSSQYIYERHELIAYSSYSKLVG
ncbi:MAG: N-acetyl-beta-hexosaminidase [Haloplasmataceae bacterium]|jgi:hypothetical protein|nr:N-acetyl-beta-hexosaminidase [Haloplasmataceae bacterium]